MNQSKPTIYESVLKVVQQWPVSLRLKLAQDILKTILSEIESVRSQRQTLNKALGLLSQHKPPPTDEEVERWLDERRMEKYLCEP